MSKNFFPVCSNSIFKYQQNDSIFRRISQNFSKLSLCFADNFSPFSKFLLESYSKFQIFLLLDSMAKDMFVQSSTFMRCSAVNYIQIALFVYFCFTFFILIVYEEKIVKKFQENFEKFLMNVPVGLKYFLGLFSKIFGTFKEIFGESLCNITNYFGRIFRETILGKLN